MADSIADNTRPRERFDQSLCAVLDWEEWAAACSGVPYPFSPRTSEYPRIKSPTMLKVANTRVAVLPRFRMTSFARSPRVPPNQQNRGNRADSSCDLPHDPSFCCLTSIGAAKPAGPSQHNHRLQHDSPGDHSLLPPVSMGRQAYPRQGIPPKPDETACTVCYTTVYFQYEDSYLDPRHPF